MHDIWNPWHGCKKISDGCANCYMYYLDLKRDKDGSNIYKTQNFNYPLAKDRNGQYKIKSGETIRVCMTSDFFLDEADAWREEAWDIIRIRKDVKFFILTKRIDRVKDHLPSDWNDGYENVSINVTVENQKWADYRLPILLDIPSKHKGIMCAPFIGEINIDKYLSTCQIGQVICGGENYDGCRPCNFDWVKSLRKQCVDNKVNFYFFETGTKFIKDNKLYTLPNKDIQSKMAYKSNMSIKFYDEHYNLYDEFNNLISEDKLYKPYFSNHCKECGSRIFCNGCSKCGRCKI